MRNIREELLYAIRVEGTFTRPQTRSVPEQEKPYVPLEEAIQGQVVFDFAYAHATPVGFRLPPDFENVNVTGFHFHALTKDRTAGGHVRLRGPGRDGGHRSHRRIAGSPRNTGGSRLES